MRGCARGTMVLALAMIHNPTNALVTPRRVRLGGRVSPALVQSTQMDETEGTDAVEDPQPPIALAPAEDLSAVEFVFGKPGEFERDLRAMGTTPRRFFLQLFFVAPLIALAGNLFGLTSFVLSFFPDELLSKSRLDTYFPTKGFKRCIGSDGSYEFLVPENWLQDQAVVLAKAQRFDPGALEMNPRRRKLQGPDVAFGPAERSGDNVENVSVVRSRLPNGFQLRALGSPSEAAQKLLDTAIAPPGSGRTARLIVASEQLRGKLPGPDGGLCYEFEYSLTRTDGRQIRNIAVIAARNGELFTLTVLVPESEWAEKESVLRQVQASFRLLE